MNTCLGFDYVGWGVSLTYVLVRVLVRYCTQAMAADKRLQTEFSAGYARFLLNQALGMTEKTRSNLRARCVHLGKSKRGVNGHDSGPPLFWSPVQANYKALGKYRAEQREVVYGSEGFEWEMCGKARLGMKPENAVYYFSKLLRHCCPAYMEVLDRFGPATLLHNNRFNLDLAFLEGVWRYSHVLGKAWFPQGLYAWPPPDDWKATEECFKGQSTWCSGVPCASDSAAACS